MLLDPDTGEVTNDEGEICSTCRTRSSASADGCTYDAPDRTARATEGGYYRTGDIASRDDDGNPPYVGRRDDVFKASGAAATEVAEVVL